MKSVFFILSLLLPSAPMQAKTTAYTIELAGMDVGKLYTHSQQVNGITIYQLSSLVDFWMMVRIRIEYRITVKYDASKMVESNAASVANGKSYSSTVEWKDDAYRIDCHTYKYDYTGRRPDPIRKSLLLMYFEEPENDRMMFSENYGVDAPVKKTEDHTWLVETQGNRNYFRYRDGVMVLAEMHSPVRNYLIRIDE